MGSNSLYGPLDPAPDAGYVDAPPRMGFFTDTSVCIGCKACEVACKEWNLIPDDGFNLLGTSYDNTGGLTANSWRHVAFIEQSRAVDLPMPTFGRPGDDRHGHEHRRDRGRQEVGRVERDPLVEAGEPTAPPECR